MSQRVTKADLKRLAHDLTLHTGFNWVFLDKPEAAMYQYAICPIDQDGKPLDQYGWRGDAKSVYNFAAGANSLAMIQAGVHRNAFEKTNTDMRTMMSSIHYGLINDLHGSVIAQVHKTYSENRWEIEMANNERFVVTLEPLKCWSDKPEDQPKSGEKTN